MGSAQAETCKLVVRHLPPALPEEEFRAAIEPLFKYNELWFRYVPGKTSNKGFRHSRAFLSFPDTAEALDFRAAFNGHVFVGARGQQFKCRVEFAPYQKVPRLSTRKDPKEGTLEKDPEYQDFLQKLEKDPQALFSSGPTDEAEAKKGPEGEKKITPLMQYLADKWSGKLFAKEGSRRGRRSKGTETKNTNPQRRKGLPSQIRSNVDEDVPPGFEKLPSSARQSFEPSGWPELDQSKEPQGWPKLQNGTSSGADGWDTGATEFWKDDKSRSAADGANDSLSTGGKTARETGDDTSKDKRTSRSQRGKPASKKPPKRDSHGGREARNAQGSDPNHDDGASMSTHGSSGDKKGPKMILQRKDPQASAPDNSSKQAKSHVPAQEQTPKQLPKPSRVRAGFQVYQPRVRTSNDAPK